MSVAEASPTRQSHYYKLKTETGESMMSISIFAIGMNSPERARDTSRLIIRGAAAALLSQVLFFSSMNLSAQSIVSNTREKWIERFTHRPTPRLGPGGGRWDGKAEYSDLLTAGAAAINDWGDIVGNYCEATPACENALNQTGPYLFSQGEYSSLMFPPSIISAFPSGINLLGQIVGPSFDASFGFHGFVLRGSHFTQIDAPGAGSGFFLGTVTNGVNTQGEVVGQYYDPAGMFHDFIWRAGKFSSFSVPLPGSTYDMPTAINDRGDIAGYFNDKGGVTHGYLLRSGIATQLDFPGATSTQALGINFEGDIVGYYTVPATNPYGINTYFYGFLLRNGKYTTINPPNGSNAFDGPATMANGINDLGVIVGSYQTATGPGSAQVLGFVRRW